MKKHRDLSNVAWKDYTLEELKAEAIGCWSAIYQNDCYGNRDLINLDGATAELEKRGYTLKETTTVKVVKLEEVESE